MQSYDPGEIHLVYGIHKLEGYAKDSFIEVARTNATYSVEVGAAGHAVAVKSNDRSGHVQVSLLQTSASNAWLATQFNISDAAGSIAAPLLLIDRRGTTICECAAALIEKPADIKYGTSLQERTWRFLCGTLIMFPGGN